MKKLFLMAALIAFNPIQSADDLDTKMHDYIMDNPEVIIESIQKFQLKQQQSAYDQAEEKIQKQIASVVDEENDPIIGNPDGDVTIIEFFDYQCGHCKNAHPTIKQLLSERDDIRVVLKEFPILGETSTYASQVALAAKKQDKFLEIHDALMEEKGRLSNKRILEIAEGLGLNMDQLKEDMKSTSEILQKQRVLGMSLGINATPAFILTENPITESSEVIFMPGAVPKARFEQSIADIQE